jgi:hypothetical protein
MSSAGQRFVRAGERTVFEVFDSIYEMEDGVFHQLNATHFS